MRILQVTEASGSGTLGVVSALASGLAEAGHDVALLYGTRPETPSDLRAQLPDKVELVALPWAQRTLRAQAAATLALRRLVGSRRPDIVHLHSSFAGAAGVFAGGGAAVVYTPHGYSFARRGDGGARLAAYRAIERAVAHRCDVVAAVSEAEAALARDVLRAPRVQVVANGIPEVHTPPDAPRSPPLVVGSGRIVPQRRPAASARILSAIADVAAVRWIGGAPGTEDAQLREAGVPITGWLSHADAVAALGEATVLLNWSEWDGAPLAVLEAMARDVVVVASDIPANRELVGEPQVRTDEAEAIELIRAVLADDGLRERLLAGQRARVASRSSARMVAEYADLYDAVLAARRRAHPAVAPVPTAVTRKIGGPWS